MRLLPWGNKAEHRASSTNAVVDALLSGATQAQAEASATAAATSAIHAIADAFAVANVAPPSLAQVLNPVFLVDLARRVLITGNAVYAMDVDDDGLSLVPASRFEVSGGYRPSSWTYKLDLPRPSGSPITRVVPAEGVAHVRVGTRPDSPWQGVSPLREAGLTSDALANLDRSLGFDTSPPTGILMAMPDGATQTQTDLAGC